MENGDPESLLAVWDSGGAALPFIAVHTQWDTVAVGMRQSLGELCGL